MPKTGATLSPPFLRSKPNSPAKAGCSARATTLPDWVAYIMAGIGVIIVAFLVFRGRKRS